MEIAKLEEINKSLQRQISELLDNRIDDLTSPEKCVKGREKDKFDRGKQKKKNYVHG